VPTASAPVAIFFSASLLLDVLMYDKQSFSSYELKLSCDSLFRNG
jgi:hypothetical protein